MAANDKTDGPSKQDFDKLQRLVAQLTQAHKKTESRIMAMDERLRNLQARVQTVQANLERISRR